MNARTSLLSLAASFAFLAAFQAQAASPWGDNPDLYGHVLVAPPHATTDATIEPGHGDTYGSILLDIKWPQAHSTRTVSL